TGSDVESVLIRSKECAVLANRDNDVQRGDVEAAVSSFIDPLDPELLKLQELAAVLACSDKRYLPERYRQSDRALLLEDFWRLNLRFGRFPAWRRCSRLPMCGLQPLKRTGAGSKTSRRESAQRHPASIAVGNGGACCGWSSTQPRSAITG